MRTLVVDASVAVKWVIPEAGAADALSLRRQAKLISPDLLLAECANILWKKVRRNELSKDEALLAVAPHAAGAMGCGPAHPSPRCYHECGGQIALLEGFGSSRNTL